MLHSWDDLRFCLAVARRGTLREAGQALTVHHATVSRRIRALEEQLGLRVFDRTPDGYRVTEAGREVIAHAEAVEQRMLTLDRRTRGRDTQLTGILRVTTIGALARSLSVHFQQFCARHPGVELHLTTSNVYADLDRREADVAIRITASPPDHLVGRRLGELAIAPYAAAAAPADRPLHERFWIGWVESLSSVPMEQWLARHVPKEQVRCRIDELGNLEESIRAGLGAGHLPCLIGDAAEGLRRVGPLLDGHGLGLWLLTHPDLRRTARVRAFMAHMADAMTLDRDLLEGRATG